MLWISSSYEYSCIPEVTGLSVGKRMQMFFRIETHSDPSGRKVSLLCRKIEVKHCNIQKEKNDNTQVAIKGTLLNTLGRKVSRFSCLMQVSHDTFILPEAS